ncbi:MAG: hypothetical protein QOJ39_1453 [Candidatus Eremiobacteraeota bacterium]|jgi:hypothetical protein|nr:hypothetical protein [Candidatus Eremiobacteraeota bacterium]
MRSLLARLAVLGAFAVSMSACSGGNGNSLPFAGPPNNAGGTPGTIQSGGNNQTLLRFIQGSPDSGAGASGTVDVCVDNLPLLLTGPQVNYGQASGLYAIPGGITHTISVFPGLGTPTSSNAGAGAECPTAPGPYFGTSAIAVITLSIANPLVNNRITVVLGGTAASGTRGLYVYQEPSFAIAPAGNEVISHNAAPAFSKGPPARGVGFGICTTTVAPCTVPTALTGAQNRPAPTLATVIASGTPNSFVQSPLATIPAGFYDGIGVAAGAPVPITSIAAPTPVAGQPYVIELYAIDGPAGGLNLVGFPEQTLGFGF